MAGVATTKLEYKQKMPTALNNSILNVKPIDTRTKGTVSPTEKSDTLQLKSKYQNSDLKTIVHKGIQGI